MDYDSRKDSGSGDRDRAVCTFVAHPATPPGKSCVRRWKWPSMRMRVTHGTPTPRILQHSAYPSHGMVEQCFGDRIGDR